MDIESNGASSFFPSKVRTVYGTGTFANELIKIETTEAKW